MEVICTLYNHFTSQYKKEYSNFYFCKKLCRHPIAILNISDVPDQ